MITLGIDTSNYTTSCAIYDSETGQIIQKKKLLPVKEGEKGLRQSDAVFHHTQQLYPLIAELMNETSAKIEAIGVSDKPRDLEGSYMPCFTVGLNTASSIASVTGVPLYRFSHQAGHIMAALYSSERMDLAEKRFLAFHVSGGTTEALLVTTDEDRILKAEIVGKTNDLNLGQVIDRAGVMLGLQFPCGKEIEKLALNSEKTFSPKICVTNGDCNVSGVENIVQKMLSSGEKHEDIARFCLDFAGKTIEKMTDNLIAELGNMPIVYAGGVMSDVIIKERLKAKFNCEFALPDFSCDNAAGTALLTFLRSTK